MSQRPCVARMSALLMGCIVYGSVLTAIACANDAPLSVTGNDAATPLIQKMIGTWNVRQRMWPGAAAKAIDLPAAVAHRVLIGSAILQELMTPASESGDAPFTRVAYFNYNGVTQQYEYFSLDTRAPQMMNERSRAAGAQGKSQHRGGLTLYGGRFVAAQWGESKNVPFRYRIVVGQVEKEQQAVRLYLTPQSGASTEFLAFEYVYTRSSSCAGSRTKVSGFSGDSKLSISATNWIQQTSERGEC